jgi:BMFP domain-containing protein YqiC
MRLPFGLDRRAQEDNKAAMQSENPIIADFVKLANSAAGTMAGMTREARQSARERLREALGGMDFVSREEFETVKAMAQKAREQADAMEARLAELEARLAAK